jgi:hypothetical protein
VLQIGFRIGQKTMTSDRFEEAIKRFAETDPEAAEELADSVDEIRATILEGAAWRKLALRLAKVVAVYQTYSPN